ncbi:hypothetical protein ABZP36_000165 [Zizania latifolia]
MRDKSQAHWRWWMRKASNVDMAWRFFRELKVQGLRPGDVLYTSMIWVLCKEGKLDETEELFAQIDGGRKGYAGRFEDAYKLLERLRERGCIPSVVPFNLILTCLGKKRKVDEALSLFEVMKKDAEPNAPTYNIIRDNALLGLCKAKRLEEACKIFEIASHRGCNPDSVMYCSLIDGQG